ncbi:phage/plasmid primase, P4 family [Oceanibium sediminis]|uniref:phage/plasmid primase, P4 family n=1 Tax=Oceanibium sediminis TaxID=2026339 RepID=UPI000DD2BAED|nr:phage/plasmid primase, P4 family [Oceanibium sediminis]
MSSKTLHPHPDAQAIGEFVDCVFSYLEGYVPIRLLRETADGNANSRSEYVRVGNDLVGTLARLAGDAAEDWRGLYVVPATVPVSGRARAVDIAETAVIPVDLDSGDIDAKRDYLVRHLGRPALEVASGGVTDDGHQKRHLYWRLTEAAKEADLDVVAHVRRAIAKKVGADPSFGSLHQPIRVAGSVHAKNGTRTPVRILYASSCEAELSDLAELVDSMPAMDGIAQQAGLKTRRQTARSLMMQPVQAGGGSGITRFEALSKVMGHWIRMARFGNVSVDAAFEAVSAHNQALIAPPWDEGRLHREFQALLGKDRAENYAVWAKLENPLSLQVVDTVGDVLTEDALAQRFVERHGADWRYVRAWGCWFRWSGTHWTRDETGHVRELIRHICRAAARDLKPHEARRVANRRTIEAVERIASSDPDIVALSEDWDVDLDLLNTPSGIIQLETGEIVPNVRDRMMTCRAGAVPSTDCPRWTRFIAEVTGGDAELAAYLARLAGYCLTGSNKEQVFFFLYGSGANGKSVFLQMLARVLASYAATAPLETFMASKSTSHPTDLAGLRGKRLVTVGETESGRAWAETRIKAITGGDPIRARFMHRDFFEFVPTFKLIVAGNHRPQLRGVGEAMRRRLHLVPFTVTIPPENRDKDLHTTLEKELGGILSWMLKGLSEWRRVGLAPPSAVTDAAQEYFEEEDLLGQWIRECCAISAHGRATSAELFMSWRAWADAAGIETGSQKSLAGALRERGFIPVKTAKARAWGGISIARQRGAARRDDA